jgi:beta-glucosidase
MAKSLFPHNFFWGASTASHQVEGGTKNQWSEWEEKNAERLAHNAHKRLGWMPAWDAIKDQAQNPKNYHSGKGVEHYERYKEDFAIIKKLNLNSFRFGIEWARIEPAEGQWDEAAIEHYRQYIKELNSQGIEPILNLWHWTMPTWFTKKGGFTFYRNLKYFERYAKKVADEFGDQLTYVITLNEPNVYASFSYLTGEWPPNIKSWVWFAQVYWNLTRAHKLAYKALKASNKGLQVGIAAQLANIQAKRPHHWFDQAATKWMRYFWNWWFLNRINKYQDFLGFNYYFTDYYKGFRRQNPKVPLNDLGWYMEPEGLYPLLVRVWAHYKKPIIVAENGVADMNDQYRQWWIEETIIAMERAISEGVDIRGYFHWSLLDNFEWAYGWWPKFGLVEVDRSHDMKRTIRPSATWFATQIERLQNK